MEDAVRRRLEFLSLRGRHVLVGVSGGSDSTALLLLLRELRDEFSLQLTAAHLDHGWRAESAEDAAWVSRLCKRIDVPLAGERVDLPALAAQAGKGLEECARDVRREFLKSAALRSDATAVALGHTADDQAETILHHVIRGSGLRGAAGMRASSELTPELPLVRPLLELTRPQLRQWLGGRGQDWRDDTTNFDAAHTRNRIRHVLLPLLRAEFNPQVDSALQRLSRQVADALAVVEGLAAAHLQAALLEESEQVVRLDASRLPVDSRHLLREVGVLLWRRRNWPLQGMTYEHWDRLASLLADGSAEASLSLPGGLQASRSGTLIRIERPS